MDWKAEYRRKLVSAEEAARLIKSGERVMIAGGSTDQPKIMKEAIFARRGELHDVYIYHMCPVREPGWLDPGYEENFKVDITGYISPIGRPSVTERRTGFIPISWDMTLKEFERAGEHSLWTGTSSPSRRPTGTASAAWGPFSGSRRSS